MYGLGQFTEPFVPEDSGEWWEEPLGELVESAEGWLESELGPDYPSTHPYGPGTPQWGELPYPEQFELNGAALEQPAPTVTAAAGNALQAAALATVAFVGLRAAGAI